MAYADVNEILEDGKDIVAKQDGGILVVGAYGEQVLAAKDTSELPDGLGGTGAQEATTTVPGTVRKTPAIADSTATTIAGLVSDYNALLAALRTAGIITTA